MDKKELSERDICTKYITPALVGSGWDLFGQIREEYTFTIGRIIVRGKMHTRGQSLRADYILSYKQHLPLAVIEAKDNNHRSADGMQKALIYAEALDIPYAFSSNGDTFVFHDRTGMAPMKESEIAMDAFPSPGELWRWYCEWKNLDVTLKEIIETPYYGYSGDKPPRYYQTIAINRSVEAVARGQQRILLVMATGTGKTYTAFQIIWRLWKARQKRRILFLADRNFLIDQARNNDFKPFGQAMTKITKHQVNKSFEIYLSLYQGMTGTEEALDIYKQFSREFFDLIVIDECHRSSAAEDSAWRDILDYFSSATHIGLTATPKETRDVSNIHYFGQPVYTYSLKQGIEDGFLAPYKVVRIDFDRDLQGWRPERGKRDKHGLLIEDRTYNQRDFDRELVLEQRTELVAKKITEFMEATDPFQKTIVFCEDIDHAERMRRCLVNLNAARVTENRRYVMRITGDEAEGKNELDNFIDPESRYPVIATTSKLLNTGVDAQTCKLIVIDQRITSMTEFKQIIGRGTRINEDFDKFWFTIMDFKKATELFSDPAFDGDPVQVYEPKEHDSPVPPDEDLGFDADDQADDMTTEETIYSADPGISPLKEEGRVKYVVHDVTVTVVDERIQYLAPDGSLIVESLRDYTKACVLNQFKSLSDFLRKWTTAERKRAVIDELGELGVLWEPLSLEVEGKLGKKLDPFDLICHVAWGQPPLSRRERAENVRKRDYFTKYGEQARSVLDSLLDKYSDTGIENIEDIKVLQLEPFSKMGTAGELVKCFGGKAAYLKALKELEKELYA